MVRAVTGFVRRMGTFGRTLERTFESARECGSLVFTPSESIIEKVDGIEYMYTVAPALQKKPTAMVDHKPQLRPSPWDPPEPELVVEKSFEDRYMVVLNKFAVVPRHFLLVTKDVQPQSGPLAPADLAACRRLLCQADAETGKRHLGFYNAGPSSGASIAHRHVQFIELSPDFTPFVDELVRLNPEYKEMQRPLSDTRAPFAHFVVPTGAEGAEDAETLGLKFSTIMARVLTVLRAHDVPMADASYNFVFTQNWMMGVPRRTESVEGRGINAVGTVGLLLAKSQADLDFYRSKGPQNVVADVGFPPVDISQDEGEYDY